MRALPCFLTMSLLASCSAAAACDAADIGAALERKSSEFKSLRGMVAAMQGTWHGCDDEGNPVRLTVDARGEVSGTMVRYWNRPAVNYTDCRWHGVRNFVSLNSGRYGVAINAVACAGQPYARDWEHGDTGHLFLFGGANRIDYIVVRVRGRIYAVVGKNG